MFTIVINMCESNDDGMKYDGCHKSQRKLPVSDEIFYFRYVPNLLPLSSCYLPPNHTHTRPECFNTKMHISAYSLAALAASAWPATTQGLSWPRFPQPRSHLTPDQRAAIASGPDLTFHFPKNGTFELIQSLTEILALEARESNADPPPGGKPPPGTPPPKKKDPYKCGCHCTILICGCTCKTIPLPSMPPGVAGRP